MAPATQGRHEIPLSVCICLSFKPIYHTEAHRLIAPGQSVFDKALGCEIDSPQKDGTRIIKTTTCLAIVETCGLRAKYFTERGWIEAFLAGEVLFRSLAYFRDYEDEIKLHQSYCGWTAIQVSHRETFRI